MNEQVPHPPQYAGESDVDEANRRPIAARRLAVFQAMSRWLAAAGVTPNAISVAGMIAGVLAGAAFAGTRFDGTGDIPLATIGFLLGPLFIGLRLLCNMLDGMVAVESGTSSRLGAVFNELPDRISDTATLVGAGYALGGNAELGFVASILALLVAYVRSLGANAGASQHYEGPMAKQQRMLVIGIAALVSAILPGTTSIESLPANPGAMSFGLAIVIAGAFVTFVRRLVGIAHELTAALETDSWTP